MKQCFHYFETVNKTIKGYSVFPLMLRIYNYFRNGL